MYAGGIVMRFAIIGCGEAGSRRASAIESVNGAEITVCVDAVKERAANLALASGADASTDWRSAVTRKDVDAVVIATTNNLHTPIGVAAAESGKHILCERPLATTLAEATRLVGAARENGVKLKTGLHLRYHPTILKVHEILSSGRIGQITFIRGRTGRGSYSSGPTEWMINTEYSGGGTLMDNGYDLLDLYRYFMGDFKTVRGYTATLVWPIEPAEDNAFAILTTADGRAASLHSSWSDWQGYLSLDISGMDGYVRLDYDNGAIFTGFRPGTPGSGLEEVYDLSDLPDRSLQIEVEELIRAIEEDREPTGGGVDGLEAMVMADAIYRASDEGQSIRI